MTQRTIALARLTAKLRRSVSPMSALLTSDASRGHVAKKRAEMLKRERKRQIAENKRRLDLLFDEFDTDKSGTLDREQLRKLLLKLPRRLLRQRQRLRLRRRRRSRRWWRS